ncbi:methyl-accepting chemotaxis protein [Deferribacter thermophilus]|uniref:methyl-accepting chemotaxis protein n=1 Tax=Deferribacter thermophilus TaxID=53573 RepID=UPI003C29720F
MSIKTKIIASYLIIALLFLIAGVFAISSFKKIAYGIKKEIKSAITLQVQLKDLQSQFLKISSILKDIKVSNEVKEVESYEKELAKFLKEANNNIKLIKHKDINKIQKDYKSIPEYSNQLIKLKKEYLQYVDKVNTVFDKIDSLYRQQKGETFIISRGVKDHNTLMLLSKIMEDILQIKIYSSLLISFTDEYDIEDAKDSIISYSRAMVAAINTLIKGGKYQGIVVDKIDDKKKLEHLNKLNNLNTEIQNNAKVLYETYLQKIKTDNSLKDIIKKVDNLNAKLAVQIENLVKFSNKNVSDTFVSIDSMIGSSTSVLILTIVTALILGVVIGIFTSNKISKVINDAVVVAKRIEEGDLNIEDIVVKNRDELATLGNSLNEMKNKLKEMIVNIFNAINVLKEVGDSLEEEMNNMSCSFKDVSYNIDSTVAATEELSQSAAEIASNVNNSLTNLNDVREDILSGNEHLNSSINDVNIISKELGKAAVTLSNLKEASKQINDVISIIIDIADQTNLLALNAAIEAARAGEQGRGFAVVADEVRKLAEKTAKSVNDISDMIKKINHEIDESVLTVNDGILSLEDKIEQLRSVGTNFSNNIERLEESINAINPIANMIEELNMAVSSIVESLNNINNTNMECSDKVQEVFNLSNKLVEINKELSELAKRFRV